MRVAPNTKTKIQETIKNLTIDDIDALIEEQNESDSEGACFLNVQIPVENTMQTVTIRVDKNGETVHHNILTLPDGIGAGRRNKASVTQPTRGFHKLKVGQHTYKEIYDSLRKKLKQYIYLLRDEYFDVLVLALMSSYFREAFYAYPFIDFHANDLECGKTTATKVVTLASFYGVMQTIPTPAVIYRKVAQSNAVLGLDSIEDTLKNKEYSGFIKAILDASHTVGIPAERCDPNDSNKIQTFDAFGIKIFSRVGGIPASVVSRAIRIPMIQAPPNQKLIKFRTAATFKEERDKMYALRIHDLENVLEMSLWIEENCGLTNRPADLFIPLLTMARLIDENKYKTFLKWAKKFIEYRKGTYEDEWNATLVEILLNHLNEEVNQKTIRDEWVSLLYNRDLLSGKEPRSVTKRLDGLSLSRTTKKTDRQIHFFIAKDIVLSWARRYRLEHPELEKNEFNELNEFLGGGPPSNGDSRLYGWLASKPDSEPFTLSMKEWTDFGAEAFQRKLISKKGPAEYEKTEPKQ